MTMHNLRTITEQERVQTAELTKMNSGLGLDWTAEADRTELGTRLLKPIELGLDC